MSLLFAVLAKSPATKQEIITPGVIIEEVPDDYVEPEPPVLQGALRDWQAAADDDWRTWEFAGLDDEQEEEPEFFTADDGGATLPYPEGEEEEHEEDDEVVLLEEPVMLPPVVRRRLCQKTHMAE